MHSLSLSLSLVDRVSLQNEAIASSTSNMASPPPPPPSLPSSSCEPSEDMVYVSEVMPEAESASKSSGVGEVKSSTALLQETIEKIFEDDLDTVNIENLITFWLTLSMPPCCDYESAASAAVSGAAAMASTSTSPASPLSILHLSESTTARLLAYLNSYRFMTVKLWHLSFRMLTQLLHTSADRLSMAASLALSPSEAVYRFVLKFLSTSAGSGELVGDECCQSLVDFLRRLGECVVAVGPDCERLFKMKLFHILSSSIDTHGCVNAGQGPIDAQITFIEFLIGTLVFRPLCLFPLTGLARRLSLTHLMM